MMKHFLLIFLTLFCLILNYSPSIGQGAFKSGYYISKEGTRQNCLISDKAWGSSPKLIQYRLNYNDPIQELYPNDIREFGFVNGDRYISEKVKIDRSADQLNNMSRKRNPEWSEEILFLKVLVDGKADLFLYSENTMQRFFYTSSDADSVRQLVYKRYLSSNNSIATNDYYQQQLWRDLNCENKSIDWFSRLRYNQSSLGDYFLAFNICEKEEISTNLVQKNSTLFNLRINPGLNLSTIALESEVPEFQDFSFGSKLNIRFGLEFECVLSRKKQNWSLIFEPIYQSYTGEKSIPNDQVSISLSTIDFPIGGRKYIALPDDNKFFIDALYVPAFTIDFSTTIDYVSGESLPVLSRHGLAVGMGWQNQYLQSGGRFYFPRSLGEQFSALSIPYSSFHLFFGFQII